MLTQKLPNAAGTLITVTTVATSLQSLIETAASEVFSLARLDGIDLRPDGDIRFLADGNTPTSTEGLLLSTFTSLRGIDLSKMQLVSLSGSVTVEIQVGKALQGETDSIQSAGGGGGGSPAGSDTELQYNNAGSFGGTTDLNFIAGLGLSIQGGLSYGWNTTETAFGVQYNQIGTLGPQNFITQNISTETVGTDILTNTLDFAVQPASFQLFGQFTSSDFPATDVGYSFIVSKNGMVYSLGTSGATGPTFTLNYDTAAQANGDVFNFDFTGKNDLTATTKYAGIRTTVIASTAAAEVGRLSLSSSVAGVDTVGLYVQNAQAFSTAGTATAPGFSVTADGSTGIYSSAANQFDIAISGSRRWNFLTAAMRSASNGTAALPVYSYVGDPDTGVFLGGVNTLSLTTGGTTKFQINSNTNIELALQLTFTATTTPTTTVNAIGRGVSGMLYNSPTGSSHIQTINGVSAFTVNGVGEAVKVTDTITASVTQTQGQQPLVSSYSIVTVVANANDTVTLPSAITGQIVRVKNEGANTLQVFPALGDSVNNGAVDASVTQATATFYMYVADDATNWTRVELTIA